MSIKALNDRDLSNITLRNQPAFEVFVKVLVRWLFLGAHQRLALLLEIVRIDHLNLKLGY